LRADPASGLFNSVYRLKKCLSAPLPLPDDGLPDIQATRSFLRQLCGENYSVAQAVAAIGPAYKFSTLARFREAPDASVEARATAKRRMD